MSDALSRLSAGDDPFVRALDRRPGEREGRVAHLLCGEPVLNATPEPVIDHNARRDRVSELETRVSDLERTVATLTADLTTLRAALGE